MSQARRTILWAASALLTLFVAAPAFTQGGLPNLYRPVRGLADAGGPFVPGPEWASRPAGPPAAVHIDKDGESVWAIIRCDETSPVPLANGGRFGADCLDKNNKLKKTDSIFKFSPDGKIVKSFGRGMFIWPHGLHIDAEGNVWVTDAALSPAVGLAAKAGVKAGHQVFKFSPDGKLLMTLGEAGVAGKDEKHFLAPAAVATAANGDIFIADGHDENGNNRVMKFARDGTFIKSWGKTGYGPGEFRLLHAIAIAPDGRVFVADRSNNRIQIFDQEGKHLATWTQFGCPSGIAFDDKGQIFVADSESDSINNPGWEPGIRIGDLKTGFVTSFILDPGGDPRTPTGTGAEFIAVDKHGNIFAGEPRPHVMQKYVKVR